MTFKHDIFTFAVAATALFPFVSAHGYVRSVQVDDGPVLQAGVPNSPPLDTSPVRLINSVDPVKGAQNPNIACGQNAQPAASVVDANPGSVVKIAWSNGEGGEWVHNIGPVINYMAPCGDGGCAAFDASQAEWFKVSEDGRNPQNPAEWYIQRIVGKPGTLDFTLPTNLVAGEYLIRHEYIGLHRGTEPGGAEFYPSCVQVRMSEPADAAKALVPASDSVMTFPGAYVDDEPGSLLVPDVFGGTTYQFPGKPVAKELSFSDQGGPVEESPAPVPDPTEPAPGGGDVAPSPSPSPCNGKKKKRSTKQHRSTPVTQSHQVRQVAKREHPERATSTLGKRRMDAMPMVKSRVMRGL